MTQLRPGDSGDHPRALFSALGGRAGPSPVPGGEAEAPACPPEVSLCGSPGCTLRPWAQWTPAPGSLVDSPDSGCGDSCVQSGSPDSLQAAPCIALHHHPAGSDHLSPPPPPDCRARPLPRPSGPHFCGVYPTSSPGDGPARMPSCSPAASSALNQAGLDWGRLGCPVHLSSPRNPGPPQD